MAVLCRATRMHDTIAPGSGLWSDTSCISCCQTDVFARGPGHGAIFLAMLALTCSHMSCGHQNEVRAWVCVCVCVCVCARACHTDVPEDGTHIDDGEWHMITVTTIPGAEDMPWASTQVG